MACIGAVFLFFGLREMHWYESLNTVGLLCLVASLPFFGLAAVGSNAAIHALFKRRGVPNSK